MDEEADLALLLTSQDQHLLKTNLLSQRMTGILGQLDTRLSRLDKTITPLGLQPLTRKAANIDAALLAITTTTQGRSAIPRHIDLPVKGFSLGSTLTPISSAPASGTTTPADETAILTRGPDIMALTEFFAALDGTIADLERMWKGFKEGRGGAREAGVRDLSKLVEVGFAGIVQLFLKIAKDGMGRMFEIDHMLSSGVPTPPNYFPPLGTLLPLSTYMVKLLFPRTPSPKTQSIIQPQHDQLIGSFGEMRGDSMKKSLGVLVGRIEEVDEGGIWEGGRAREKVRALMGLWDAMILLVEAETLLISTLFPSHPPQQLLPLTISPSVALIASAFNPTVNTIKRSLSSHAFIAFDLYQSLIRTSPPWDTTLSKCFSMTQTPTTPDVRELYAAPNNLITTLRGLAKRSFPELLVDIRMAQGEKGNSSGISDTTYTTLTYLETLPAYETTVEGLLMGNQSQRSWLMGAGDTPSPVRSAEEEGGVVNLYVADVLGTLIIHLNQRTAQMRRPIGQTYLLNNLSHMRNTTASFNSDVIGPGAEDMLNKAFREAKSQYLSEWTHLTTALTSVGSISTPRFVPSSGSSERQHLKDAASAFFDRLAEMEGICAQYPLSRQDVELRERIGKEVEQVVVQAYAGFVARCQGKSVEKYLRGTPEEIGRRVQAIFR